jgi:hypothetical protein
MMAQDYAPGDMQKYRGQNGKTFTFKVTGQSNGRIWGGSNNVYTDDSQIATAAVHAGLVGVGQTAVIKITIMPGQSSYPSIKRNGVTSIKYGSWSGSYKLSKADSGNSNNSSNNNNSQTNNNNNNGQKTNNNNNTANNSNVQAAPGDMQKYRGQNGKTFTFKVTGQSNGRIWGGSNNVYTDDSQIATAAVHAGLVGVGQTAVIKITIMPGQSSYPSIKRNGVTSIKYGSWSGSYKLSK